MKRQPSFLTTPELADRWQLHPNTLENWRSQGKGPPFVKITHKGVRYRLKEIQAYEKENGLAELLTIKKVGG